MYWLIGGLVILLVAILLPGFLSAIKGGGRTNRSSLGGNKKIPSPPDPKNFDEEAEAQDDECRCSSPGGACCHK